MRSFKSFLAEATSVDTALKVMGLQRGFSRADLDAKRKELAKAYHPDRNGGDSSKMAAVNDAYDVLVKVAGSGGSASGSAGGFDWAAAGEKEAMFAKIALDAVRAKFKPDAFTKHFEAIFKQPFSLIMKSSDDALKKPRYFGNQANINCEWYNADRTTVLYMSVTADFSALYRGNVLAAHDSDFNLSIYTEILSNRRKIKLSQQSFRLDKGNQVLQNPEVMFPAKKLGSKSQTETKRALKRRDVDLIVKQELGGSISDTYYNIPIGTNAEFQLSRITMMGHASYQPTGLWFAKKLQRDHRPDYQMVFEVARAWDLIADEVKKLKTHTFASPDEAEAAVNKILAAASYKNISESVELRAHGTVILKSIYGQIEVVRDHSAPGKFDNQGSERFLARRKNGSAVGTFNTVDGAKDALRKPQDGGSWPSGHRRPDVVWKPVK